MSTAAWRGRRCSARLRSMPPVSEALALARPQEVLPAASLFPEAGGERPADRLILGVSSSALCRPWRARLCPAGEARALAIAQAHGLPDILSRVLAGRGVNHETSAQYLDPTVRALMPEPFTLQGMDGAVARL